jgi:hypothetical protein
MKIGTSLSIVVSLIVGEGGGGGAPPVFTYLYSDDALTQNYYADDALTLRYRTA